MAPCKNPRYWTHRAWGAERLYRASHWFWVRHWRIPSLVVKYINILLFRCYIDPQAVIGVRLDLPHGGFGVVIGPEVVIGDDAIIFHNVTLGHANPGPLLIGHRLYAGTGAIILGPAQIGNDVTIGANTTVTFDVPEGATVVGPKAKTVFREPQL